MMKTRRKSKAAAAAAAEAAAVAETTTRENSPAPAAATTDIALSVAIPDDLDTGVISNLLPDINLTAPSHDSIVSLYRLIVAQASDSDATQRELEEARAEIERRDVELDQALQDRESATSELESALQDVRTELEQVKREKEELAVARASLQAQVTALSSTQNASSTEVDTLKHRIEDTEREKRDLLNVVSRLQNDSAQREDEIQTLRVNLKQARHEHQELEDKLREARLSESGTKFKLDTLTQQFKLTQEQANRTSDELTAKIEEFSKFRRSKHAELSQLQAQHDTLVQTHTATESQLKALQSAHTAQSRQLTQALTRIEGLRGQLAEQEATFSSEAAGLRRLVDMMETREAQTKSMVDSIENDFAEVTSRAQRREEALQDEVDEQKQRAEQAEKKLAELETVMERINSGEFPMASMSSMASFASGTGETSHSTPVRRNGAPSMAMNATPGTPDLLNQSMMGLSPTVAMVSRAQKSGKTFTEVYADYVKLQDEFAEKCAEFDKMDRTLAAVLAQIEERAPILSQQRAEYERLQSEATQLATQLAEAISERDAYASESEENAQKFAKSTKEIAVLQQQLDDLGRQHTALLKEVGRFHDLSIPPDEELELDENSLPAQNIDAVITNNLVLYRSIPQLQERNLELLRIVRQLGEKMEAEEKEYREAIEQEQGEAIAEAHEAIKQLQEQLESQKKSAEVTIQAYLKERDSLRAILRRERSGDRTSASASGELNAGSSSSDLERELAEIQSQFETYKTEMGVDSLHLREEVLAAQREAGQANAALAKANAKIEILNERYQMIQEQNNAQGREIDNLSKRNQQLYDQYLRTDIECNRVIDELTVAKAKVEQLQNESANLRAEKRIWEGVQERLIEENRAISTERSRLADLMGNMQRMHSDLELSGENDRKHLESQIQFLEHQIEDLRTQLSSERESLRHVTLQKDIESKELRVRIEQTTRELSKTRESLVGAETSKKHLEDRVDELTRQLRGNEEKLAVYERRASVVNGVAQHTDADMTREQQLEADVAELRSTLKVAQVDLAAARNHVQQFQEISQANETALATLNATYDEYRSSTEAELAKRISDFNALQEQLQTSQQDLSQISEKYAELQRTFESEKAAWANDRKTLEATIVDISTAEQNVESDRVSRESETREQAERAKAAEERYANEVVAHAEALKTVANLREELSKAQSSTREIMTAAETAQAKLSSSEASWKAQKEALEKEITDLNARCKDLAAQNTLLHQHLESVSSQAARIRQAADASSVLGTADGESTDDADTKLSELRSVVAYLRREKEIVDLQLELSKQENTRLQTQLNHISQKLAETEQTLSEERERAVEAASSESQHAELVEKINQLNILRESNATLRADCDNNAKRARELVVKLRQLTAELDPTKEQLRIAQAELEAKDQMVKRLESESQRWKERNAQLLSKYDRIDPAEMQSLKEEIERLSTVKEEFEKNVAERDQQLAAQTERIAHMESVIQKHKEVGQRNNQISKSRFAQYEAQIAELNTKTSSLEEELKLVTAERDQLQTRTSTDSSATVPREQELSRELDALRAEKESLERTLAEERAAHASAPAVNMADLDATIASLRDERDRLLAEKSIWTASPAGSAEPSEAQRQWESEKAELIKARDEAAASAQAASEQARKAAEEAENVRLSNEKFRARLADLTKAKSADAERAKVQQQQAVEAAIEKLKSELQSAPSEEIVAQHAEELRELEARLSAKHQEELEVAVASARADALATVSASGTGDQQQAIEAAVAARIEELKKDQEQEIAAAVDRGRMEQAAKSKIKDAQLVRVQARLKDLEAQILKWQEAGLVPREPIPAKPAASASSSTAKPAAPTAPAAAASAPAASSSSAPAPAAAPAAQRALPRKSSLNPVEGAGRGRGAGRGARGGLAIRGAGTGRGAAGGPSPTTGEGATAGVSIVGAAQKRGREEGSSADDTLAKRLRPADGASKPVTLRRDRVPPPS
ncbi:hypothetical protein WOLCODRAFT_88363 [Wolfiporia cocos MD-104 SS10]|uniref:Uncharacterized protein n=1 Tax=Wolfiporia cocos (strain MD-104) TaxID=742152 RepID=A0A2H3JJ59_WOLCO|nr:hypothetical protein WOLCODRAFT_88363 [Wolfiporia cocos MD-104 SS10]